MGPIRNLESVLSTNTETLEAGCEVLGDRRVHQPRSARCKIRGVSSNSVCGVAKPGADGPARRSSSVSHAWWTGLPPIHSPQTATGHYRMTRPSRRSSRRELLAGSGSGPGANASPLIEAPAA